MGTPIPNVTGGAATSGDVKSSVGVDFGPVTVGGLFGSSASARTGSEFLIPALILGGAILAYAFMRRKR